MGGRETRRQIERLQPLVQREMDLVALEAGMWVGIRVRLVRPTRVPRTPLLSHQEGRQTQVILEVREVLEAVATLAAMEILAATRGAVEIPVAATLRSQRRKVAHQVKRNRIVQSPLRRRQRRHQISISQILQTRARSIQKVRGVTSFDLSRTCGQRTLVGR